MAEMVNSNTEVKHELDELKGDAPALEFATQTKNLAVAETPEDKPAKKKETRFLFGPLGPELEGLVKEAAKKRKKSIAWATERLATHRNKPLKDYVYFIGHDLEKTGERYTVAIEDLSQMAFQAVFPNLSLEEADIAFVVAKTLLEFLGASEENILYAHNAKEALRKYSICSESSK